MVFAAKYLRLEYQVFTDKLNGIEKLIESPQTTSFSLAEKYQ